MIENVVFSIFQRASGASESVTWILPCVILYNCAIILFDENRMSVYDVNNENEFKCSCHVAPLLTTPTTVLSILLAHSFHLYFVCLCIPLPMTPRIPCNLSPFHQITRFVILQFFKCPFYSLHSYNPFMPRWRDLVLDSTDRPTDRPMTVRLLRTYACMVLRRSTFIFWWLYCS